MPYRSRAQAAKFHKMAERGEISKKVVKEWDEATKGKHLPKKVRHKTSRPTQKKCR